tara:strand:+ start:2029 stop:2508 length:480 start_codon:yes stop_codon:yes gene_type:complete
MNNNSKKIFNIEELVSYVNFLKKKNLIIGFTNGCFDLLHKGHIYSLSQAKKKCDYLIVGLNSDSSVTVLKGPNRPKDNQELRIKKLSKCETVDAIIIFYETTPLELIKRIIPDVLFKGSEYKSKLVAGSEFMLKNGGKLEFIDILDGYSTTNIIKNSSI